MDDEPEKRAPGNAPTRGTGREDTAAGAERGQAYQAFEDGPRPIRLGGSAETSDAMSGILFEQAMAQTRMAICLSDPRQDDAPIIFANRAFRKLTGYDEDEILGRNCRFLQGPDTDPAKVAEIRRALDNEDVVVVELLNYRKDCKPFWNALHIGPIYDAEGELLYFFGSQWDMTDVHTARAEERHARALSRELSHRVKNMFAVIGSIVNVTGRTRGIRDETHEINERIQALGRAYETTLDDAGRGSAKVGRAIRSVLAPYDPEGDRFVFDDGDIWVEATAVSTLGLVLHELATNAIKYGALSAAAGRVEIRTTGGADDTLELVWTERGGPAVTRPGSESGSGIEIVDTLLASAGGRITRDWRPEGLVATLRMDTRR